MTVVDACRDGESSV